MDTNYERLMYRRMILSSCKAKLPQYFIVTPKLLTGLDYDENVTINFIFNSPNVGIKSKHVNFATRLLKQKFGERSSGVEVLDDEEDDRAPRRKRARVSE
jgi:hypothetical protein